MTKPSNPSRSDASARRLVSGQAWDDYCDMIRMAGHRIEQWGDDISDLDRAEWYRFLTRLMRNGFERFVENRDPGNPQLRDAPWRSFINLQNPDQDHLMAEFSSADDYIITGHPGTVPYFILSAWSTAEPEHPGAENWTEKGLDGLKEFNPALLKTSHFLTSGDLQLEADGSFRIAVSRNPQPGNWLQIDEDTTGVIVRIVYHERAKEQPPSMRISRAEGIDLQPLAPSVLSSNLAKAGQLVLGYAQLVDEWWRNFSPNPNRIKFSMERYLSNGGVADREFGFGAWSKPEGDALVFEFRPPECEYWIFQICNIWQENLDVYEVGNGYITKFTAQPEEDGLVRIIVSDRDPGVGRNWIDSFSHTQGLMGLRLIQTTGAPDVVCHQVNLKTLEREGLDMLQSLQQQKEQQR